MQVRCVGSLLPSFTPLHVIVTPLCDNAILALSPMNCEAGRTVEVLVASLNRPLVVLGCVGCEVVLDTEGHVQTKSHDEDVPRRVQVHKLQLGYSNGCDNAEHDAEQAAHHCLWQRGKQAAKFACTCSG